MKKIIISEKILSELNIKDKNLSKYIGHGGYQYAFQSDDENKVIKFGRKSNEDKEEKDGQGNYTITKFAKREYNDEEIYQFEEMAKYPKYFPIFYKINKKFVVIEKLNIYEARKNYNEILQIIKSKYPDQNFRNLLYELKEVGKPEKMMQFFFEMYGYILSHQKVITNSKLRYFFYNICNLVIDITKLKLFEIDISSTNFGYDKNDNLKMLDI